MAAGASRNHNHLLGRVAGVDGIKTGYTRASGYNLVTSVERDGRRLVAVVLGGQTVRATLPFDTSTNKTYEIYKNEIDDTYQIAADTQTSKGEVEGLDVSYFVAGVEEAPMSDAYLAELSKAVPLPTSLTLEQMKPQLLAAGIDVDAVLAALTPVLTSADTATLAAFAGEPIGLDYVVSFSGRMAVEPVTGADVQVAVAESVGVRPQVTSLPVILDLLGHYPDVPEAAAAATALDELVGGPAIPLFDYGSSKYPGVGRRRRQRHRLHAPPGSPGQGLGATGPRRSGAREPRHRGRDLPPSPAAPHGHARHRRDNASASTHLRRARARQHHRKGIMR